MGNTKNQENRKRYFTELIHHKAEFIPIIEDGEDGEILNTEVPEILPVLPLRNTVLFPGVVIPISVGRQKSLKLVQDVYRGA